MPTTTSVAHVLRCAVFAGIALTAPIATAAQAPSRTATTITVTPVYATKDTSQTPVRVASEGSVFLLVEADRDWCLVEFQDPAVGRRSGYVETKNLRFSGSASSADAIPLTPPPGNQIARPAGRSVPTNVYVDVNYVSHAPEQDAQAYALQRTVFGELATAATAYPQLPRVNYLDGAVDLRFGSSVGGGVRFTGFDYTYIVGMAVSIPHPTRGNTFGRDSDATNDTLERRDRTIDIQAAYFIPTADNVVLKVYGGPSYFRVSQEMVAVIRYTQATTVAGSNIVNITTYDSREVKGTAWGFNVGADAAYFFSRHVGIGGTLRLNRATVTITEPLAGTTADLKAGGTTFGGGLRLRF